MTIAIGNHHLLTIRASERSRVRSFYGDLLDCELQSHDRGVTANIPVNIDVFHLGSGDIIGVAYVDEGSPTLSDDDARLACWLELKTDDPDALIGKLKDFGVKEITDFWDKDHFYFYAPGGQVFRIIPLGAYAASAVPGNHRGRNCRHFSAFTAAAKRRTIRAPSAARRRSFGHEEGDPSGVGSDGYDLAQRFGMGRPPRARRVPRLLWLREPLRVQQL